MATLMFNELNQQVKNFKLYLEVRKGKHAKNFRKQKVSEKRTITWCCHFFRKVSHEQETKN